MNPYPTNPKPKVPPPGRLPQAFHDEEYKLIYHRRLQAGYSDEDAKNRPPAGVALSGGGIRSATFCLGLFQTLARHGLLRHVDYLSTVSGGGYFGSFLGRMFTRPWVINPPQGAAAPPHLAAVAPMSAGKTQPPPQPAPAAAVPPGDPRGHRSFRSRSFLENLRETQFVHEASGLEPKMLRETTPPPPMDAVARVETTLADSQSPPLVWLRESGNYLAPGGANDGALDVSIYLRNWLSMLVIMLTLAFSVFMLANGIRFELDKFLGRFPWGDIELHLVRAAAAHLWWTPAVALPIAASLIFLIPLGMSYWLTQAKWEKWLVAGVYLLPVAALGIHMFCFKASPLSILGFIAGLALLAIFYRLLFEFAAKCHGMLDSDLWVRNHMAKWLRLVCLMVAASFVFAVVDGWGQSIYAVVCYAGNWHEAAPAIAGILGLTALAPVVRSLALKGTGSAGKFRVPFQYLALVFSLVLALALLTGVSLASHAVTWQGQMPVCLSTNLVPTISTNAVITTDTVTTTNTVVTTNLVAVTITNSPGELIYNHWIKETNSVRLAADNLVQVVQSHSKLNSRPPNHKPELWLILDVLGLSAVVTLLLARTIGFLNLSSYHTLYSSRIVRAYQGASDLKRWPDVTNITDVETNDDIAWDKYEPHAVGGPVHLVNCTINCTESVETAMESTTAIGLNLCVGPVGICYGQHQATFEVKAAPDNKEKEKIEGANESPKEPGKKEFITDTESVIAYDEGKPAGKPIKVESLPLGDWIGISGAAFTTGLGNVGAGRGTTLGTSLLCGLFNVRLGYWWKHKLSPSDRISFNKFLPVQSYLTDEFTASFHMVERDHWYLSDGGHFENTAAYELIRRRVPFIIIADCGADPDGTFDDLGNLARRIRIDFGAELVFPDAPEVERDILKKSSDQIGALADLRAEYEFTIRPGKSRIASAIKSIQADLTEPAQARRVHKHAALAHVHYPEDSQGFFRTTILIIKPGLSGDEPADLVNYQINNETFPQQTTADQFYDEAQWESYRKLGEHAMESILKDDWLKNKLTGRAA